MRAVLPRNYEADRALGSSASSVLVVAQSERRGAGCLSSSDAERSPPALIGREGERDAVHRDAIERRLRSVEEARAAGEATVPTNVVAELTTNPFLLARDVDHFAELRRAKDNFR